MKIEFSVTVDDRLVRVARAVFRKRNLALIAGLIVAGVGVSQAAWTDTVGDFTTGAVISSADVNTKFTTLFSAVNHNEANYAESASVSVMTVDANAGTTDVVLASVTLDVRAGKRVFAGLVPTTADARIDAVNSNQLSRHFVQVKRDSTVIGGARIRPVNTSPDYLDVFASIAQIQAIDTAASAGTHTYSVVVPRSTSEGTSSYRNYKLVAYEL